MAPSSLRVEGKEKTFMFLSYLQREGFHFSTNHKALICNLLVFSQTLSIFFFPPLVLSLSTPFSSSFTHYDWIKTKETECGDEEGMRAY